MTDEEFNKKWNIHKIVQEAMKTSHSEPAPETRERLAILDTNQKFMVQEITEIKKLVEGLDTKLNTVIENKADKKEVDELYKTVEDLKSWKIKLVAIGSVILFVMTFLKDPIITTIKAL